MMDMPDAPSPVVCVYSARPDGGTTVTLGLSGVAAPDHRVLAIDANVERAELARLLDLDEAPGLYELAFRTRLSPVETDDLEAHVQWRDGVGVLPGVANESEGDEITVRFMEALLSRAAGSFDRVFVDRGRPTQFPAPSDPACVHLWVLRPTPLGLAAFDKSVRELDTMGMTWWRSALVALDNVTNQPFRDVVTFIERRYGLHVAGVVPWAPDFWSHVETTHSVRALSSALPDGRRFRRAYGVEAQSTRRALRRLTIEITKGGLRRPQATAGA